MAETYHWTAQPGVKIGLAIRDGKSPASGFPERTARLGPASPPIIHKSIVIMKISKSTLGIIGLSASFFAAGVLSAQSGSAPKAATGAPTISSSAEPKYTKAIKVSTLSTAEANQEFQRNVQIIQAKRQAAFDLKQQVDKESNAAKKKELQAKLDDALKVLNEDNQKMFKAYGFSLERNYQMVVETSSIYMMVTDEEAARYEKDQAAAAAAKPAPQKK